MVRKNGLNGSPNSGNQSRTAQSVKADLGQCIKVFVIGKFSVGPMTSVLGI